MLGFALALDVFLSFALSSTQGHFDHYLTKFHSFFPQLEV